jgi:dihydrolipoamide dehydrogenase
VKVDRHYRTNIDGIWAIGDVIAGPMLAHKASDEGIAVAEIIAGKPGYVNYDAIPSVVYTRPEAASVGKTEDELRGAGILYTVGKFPFSANARARAMLKIDGFVKILAEKGTGYVLGAHVLGPATGELIAEITLLIQSRGTAEELRHTCHAHPTLSEAVRDAALGAMGRSIDI